MSPAPSSAFSISPTGSPTESPTTREPDLFTILITLEGLCSGCPADASLFDAVVNGGRKLPSSNHDIHRSLAIGGPGCFCAIGAEEGGLTKEEYFAALEEEKGFFQQAFPFVEEPQESEEVEIFNCTRSPFQSVAAVDFEGNLEKLSKKDQKRLEEIFLKSYNIQAQQSCDPLVRQVSNVQTLQVRRVTEMPSMSPSASFNPTASPSAPATKMPSIPPSASPNPTIGQNTPSVSPSVESSFAPTFVVRRLVQRELQDTNSTIASNATSLGNGTIAPTNMVSLEPTKSPTQSPTTREADLFSLVFLVTGVCNGGENRKGRPEKRVGLVVLSFSWSRDVSMRTR